MIEFANKEYFLLLLLLLPYIIWYVKYRKKAIPAIRLGTLGSIPKLPKSWKVRLIHVPMILGCVAYILLVLILARPQQRNTWHDKEVEGLDIMLAMDVSTSMLSTDIAPNRLVVAKDVATDYVSNSPDFNIGLTIFAGEAFTQCPMTIDHSLLLSLLDNVSTDIVEAGVVDNGTAIGMGLANAVSRLKDSKAKSKVVILLTDGSNNSGDVSPATAADIAHSFGIRVYTIGFGTDEQRTLPVIINGRVQYVMNEPIDYKTLQEIALTTNGKFYRAENADELARIYKDIDKLEKTKIKAMSQSRRYDIFQPFTIALLIVVLLKLLLEMTVFRRIP